MSQSHLFEYMGSNFGSPYFTFKLKFSDKWSYYQKNKNKNICFVQSNLRSVKRREEKNASYI